MSVFVCVKELLEAREQECVRLRRELKELRNTVSLRRLVPQGEISSGHFRAFGLLYSFRIVFLITNSTQLYLDP